MFWRNIYGEIKTNTVRRYAIPVYAEDFIAFALFWPDSLSLKYFEAPIEREAAIPTIKPVDAIKIPFCKANVNPIKVPVISTMASLRPRTIEPAYLDLFFFDKGFSILIFRMESLKTCFF